MLNAFPTDVIVLDYDGMSLARFSRSRKRRELLQARTYRLNDAFSRGAVSPALTSATAIAEAVRRARIDAGSFDHVALLLPDSWFRINLIEVNELPEKRSEAEGIVRWSLKRTMPIDPELLRLRYVPLGRTEGRRRLLVLSALEQTLSQIEQAFLSAGVSVASIEPIGLNVWNAITSREAATNRDRLFFHVRENEFTSGVFRGSEPVFLRSRNLSGERTLAQEIRLSASYLRDNLRLGEIETCYVAGSTVDESINDVIRDEFGTPISRVQLRDFTDVAPGLEATGMDSELIACTGVFAA